jgi:hypothetical protein
MKPRGTHPAAYGQRMWQQYYYKTILKSAKAWGSGESGGGIGGSGRLRAILLLLGEHNEVFWSSWGSGVACL